VPGDGFAGIAGVESGKAAPLVGGPPGMVLHTVIGELPTGGVGGTFPVVVTTIGVGMVPNADAGIIAVGDIAVVDDIVAAVPGLNVETAPGPVEGGTGTGAKEGDGSAGNAGSCGTGTVEPGRSDMKDVAGCADNVNTGAAVLTVAGVEELVADVDGAVDMDCAVPFVPTVDDREVTGTDGAPAAICPVGVEQVTTVPGIVGSEASGTGANVVSGTPGCVVAENGLGPLSGDVKIVPGVDESPMAVVPIVETCAMLALQPNSRAAANRCRIAIISSVPI
jgi:hypothetical protein